MESEFTKIIDSNVGRDEKLFQLFSLMAESHVETQSIMKEGFVGLAIQDAELKEQNKALKDQLNQLQEQLKFVTEELQKRKERERLRLAIALLLVTCIRINELLPLKMKQLESLFTKHWISINRAKRGPANHKAFLTKVNQRRGKNYAREAFRFGVYATLFTFTKPVVNSF